MNENFQWHYNYKHINKKKYLLIESLFRMSFIKLTTKGFIHSLIYFVTEKELTFTHKQTNLTRNTAISLSFSY